MAIVNMIDEIEIDFSKDVQIWCTDKPEFIKELNNLNCFRFVIIYDGEGIMQIDERRFAFIAPLILCLNETERISIESLNISVKIIYFHPMAMNYRLNYTNIRDGSLTGTDKNDCTYLKPFYMRSEKYFGYIDLGIDMAKYAVQLYHFIEEELLNKSSIYWPCNTRSMFLELLLYVERLYSKRSSVNLIQLTKEPNVVDKALQYIHLNYNKKITISQLTKQLNINRTTLNDQFNKATNTSVIDYLIKYRINLASMILRDSLIPVSSVAERVGFDDLSNFVRFFKKHIGMTPTEYRNQNCWLNDNK